MLRISSLLPTERQNRLTETASVFAELQRVRDMLVSFFHDTTTLRLQSTTQTAVVWILSSNERSQIVSRYKEIAQLFRDIAEKIKVIERTLPKNPNLLGMPDVEKSIVHLRRLCETIKTCTDRVRFFLENHWTDRDLQEIQVIRQQLEHLEKNTF
jgi:hypothetical protein